GKNQRTGFGTHRKGELSGVVEVIEDEQGIGPSGELVEGSSELAVRRLVADVGAEPAPELGQPLGERFSGVDPEDAVGVVRLMAVDVLDGELGLANAAHAREPGRPDADRLPLPEGVVKGI